MAKYDHGGGCACGLSRFCDCSNATVQDRLDREAYDKMYPPKKKEKHVALKQMEELYDQGHRAPGHCGSGVGQTGIEMVNKGLVRVKSTANGVTVCMDISMPGELLKAIEKVQRLAANSQ